MNIPRPEHPRPDMYRNEWINLNGEWEFEIDRGASGKERGWHERGSLNDKITVPFVPESVLSGVGDVDFMRSVWYRRDVAIPREWLDGGRVLLRFGAVDYLAEAWVNGVSAGTHEGGYTPFAFDVTALLNDGENSIVVNAYDDVQNPTQPSGKQSTRYNNYACLYTRCTGIWQTVWLEHVPDVYIENIKLTPDVDNDRLYIEAAFNRNAGGLAFGAAAALDGAQKSETTAKICGKTVTAVMELADPVLWSPGAPVLYDLTLTAGQDKLETYFGMRKVAINGNAVEINGKPVFQRLVLDQGYYPDGIYTASSDEAVRRDIELSMAAGFNGARMHMKVFEPRYLYWADKLGYIIWGEYPNWGLDLGRDGSLLHMLPEWMEALKRDYNHPAVVGWCPFNETSRDRVAGVLRTVYNATRLYDAYRPVIDTSGYVHVVTDIYDVHDYDQNVDTFAERYRKTADGTEIHRNNPDMETYEGQPYFVSEFGGTWWNIDGGEAGWGYGKSPEDIEEFYSRFKGLVDTLLDNPRMCGFCYTQITDVMQEKNGLYAFDRTPKFDAGRLKKIVSRPAYIEQNK